jgi:hypothetical protein
VMDLGDSKVTDTRTYEASWVQMDIMV